ncbi:hypothetical protein NEFER03_0601 [Nematocida sp. LUAm3]|nr:hypothetical protein NEFER03_0601 [Nematocida sp. LUAm3]
MNNAQLNIMAHNTEHAVERNTTRNTSRNTVNDTECGTERVTKCDAEWLHGVHTLLCEPFTISISGETYRRVMDMGHAVGHRYPFGWIHKVLGGIYGRIQRGTVNVIGEDAGVRATIGDDHLFMFGRRFCLPLGLKALGYAIKKGLLIDSEVLGGVTCLDSSSSVVALSLCSFYKAVIVSGQDRDRACYNKLIELVGHRSSDVRIKSAWALSLFSCGEEVLGVIEREGEMPVPNPRWAPGILLLGGFIFYRENRNIEEFEKRIIYVIGKYINISYDEKIFNGILFILWVLTKKGKKDHLCFLLVLSLFSRYSSVKRSAKGILTEYFGMYPCESGLLLMDILLKRSQKKKEILKLFSYFRIRKSFIKKFSLHIIEEGTPSRVKLGVFLWRSSNKKWIVNWKDIPNRMATLRISLFPEQKDLLNEIFPLILAKDFSSSSEQTKELLKLSLRAIRKKNIPSENTRKILLISLKRNLFLKITIKTIISLKDPLFLDLLKKNLSSPQCYLAYSLTSKEKLNLPQSLTTPLPSITLLPSLYAQAIRGTLSKKKLKTILFSSLFSYEKDPHLGDIGAYLRYDSLILLSLHLIDQRKFLNSIINFPNSQKLSLSLIIPKLSKTKLSLSKKETSSLHQRILSLSIDKSKRISSLIVHALLPALKHKTPPLTQFLTNYNKNILSLPQEDSLILSALPLIKYKTQKSPIIFSLINTLISSDNYLFKKIIKYFLNPLKHKENVKITEKALLSFSSKSNSHLINEIKQLLK